MNEVLELLGAHSSKIAAGISIILVVLMSLSVANTVLFIMETMNTPGSISGQVAPAARATGKPSYKVSNLELFGRFEEAAPLVIDAPETRLNLELQGVFVSENEALSTAIIGEKNKVGELYQIGDKLPGNATLAAVHEDHILISRGDTRMEKLMFAYSRFQSASRSAEPKPPPPSPERPERPEPGAAAQTPVSGALSPGAQTLAGYRDRLKSNPVDALSEAGVTPVSEGESKGYKIGANADNAITQAGLQPGDVILSVNDHPVGVATEDSALMDQILAASNVRVEVQRGARRFFLTVPIPR